MMGEEVKTLRARAESGDPDAQNRLANRYFKGEAVKIDYDLAFQWYRKAADQGLLKAIYNLGILHKDGFGDPNHEIANRYFLQAARKGYSLAQYSLGRSYQQGRGFAVDLAAQRLRHGREGDLATACGLIRLDE